MAGKIKQAENSSDPIENRTRDLPACSIVPHPTTLPRAPKNKSNKKCKSLSNTVAKHILMRN
jgi:hypothetical protein